MIAGKWVSLRRHLDRVGTAPGAEVKERIKTLARQLSVRAIPRVVVMTEPIGPAVFGVLRPTILLPQTLFNRARDVTSMRFSRMS